MNAAALDGALLGLLRAGPIGLLLPLPWAGRIGLALLAAVLVAPALAAAPPAGPLPGVVVRELLCGAALGLCAAVPLHAAALGGGLLDDARGDGAATARRLFLWLALALFMALGGPEALLRALSLSYEAVPLAPRPLALQALLLELPARLLLLGLLLGAHPLAALWLAHLLMALCLRDPRGAPGRGDAGAALRGILGAAVLLLGSEAVAAVLRGELARLPATLAAVVRALPG